MSAEQTTNSSVANRRNWDERVPIHRHDRSGFYAVDRFLAGEKKLHPIETRELGEVTGKRLTHLQCHFGLDTLILARQGAAVTGIDFSPAAIDEARRLAAAIGVAADFGLRQCLWCAGGGLRGFRHRLHDVGHESAGCPILPPGPARSPRYWHRAGFFRTFADAHPNMLAMEQRDGRLAQEYPLDTPSDRPLAFDEPQTYSGDPTPLAARRTYEWIHSVSRLVNALLGAGLGIEFLNEHAALPWPPFPMCERGEDGLWHLPKGIPALPLLSLRARKPMSSHVPRRVQPAM